MEKATSTNALDLIHHLTVLAAPGEERDEVVEKAIAEKKKKK